MNDLYSTLSGIISPEAVVAHNKAISDNATNAAAALAAKTRRGQDRAGEGNQCWGKALGSQNRLTEQAKRMLPESAEDRAKNIQLGINSENNAGNFPQVKGADGKDRDIAEPEKYAQVAKAYDENRRLSGLPVAGDAAASRFGNGAPILAPRPDAPTPTFGRGSVMFQQQPSQSFTPAPVARGILEVQGPPKPPGPGSVNSYETRHNLANIPDVPYAAPEVLRHPMQGAAPSGGEGVDAYEQRLGLAPTPPAQPPVVIDNTPQGRSVQQYINSLRPSAADQIALDAKKKRLTAAQRGW